MQQGADLRFLGQPQTWRAVGDDDLRFSQQLCLSCTRFTETRYSDAVMFELARFGFDRENGRNVVDLSASFPSA